MMRLPFPRVIISTMLSLVVVTVFLSSTSTAAEIGPSKGAPVIVGGGMKDPSILRRCLALAGDADATIVLIPTAGGGARYDQFWPGTLQFKEAGAKNLTVVQVTSRAEADSVEFGRPLQRARGVYFGGGRQWHLADSHLNTRTHKELIALLERGGVGTIGRSMSAPVTT